MALSDIQTQIERLASKVLDRTVRDALIALLPIFELKEVQDMATIQEALADLDTAVKGVADRQTTDHATLQAEIDALKAQGVDTSALQAAADSIETNVSALNAIAVPTPTDPTAPVEDPTTPPVDTPTDPAPPVDTPTDPAPPVDTPTDPAPPVDTPTDPAPPVDPPVDTTPPADPSDPAPADPAAPADPTTPADPTVPSDGGSTDAPTQPDGGLSAG